MTSTDKRPLKVFLCHAHADRDAVRGLYTHLTADGVDAWFDKEKLLPGQDWEFEIRKAVREADVVVVCLSKQFNQAGFRQKEVRWALDTAMEKPEGEIFIIPARLEECDTLENLRRWHWVDLYDTDGYEKLITALLIRAQKIGAVLQPLDDVIDINAVDYGELTIEYMYRLDQQIVFIVDSISSKGDKAKVKRAVSISLMFAIRAIAHLLALDAKHQARFSICHVVNGGFVVVASDGVPESHIQTIQNNFRFKGTPVGFAGHAAREGKVLSMGDVNNKKDPNFKKWIPVENKESRIGSIISIPILRGFTSDKDMEPIGVLSISSMKNGVFESVPERVLLNHFVVKIETLLRLSEM